MTIVYELTGMLRADSPIHVGDDRSGPVNDLAQFVDGAGRPTIPGTSLAGALRAALPDGHGGPDLWGEVQDRKGRDKRGIAAKVTVCDAWAEPGTVCDVRSGNAIDRVSGTTADGFLYTRTVVPVGTTFRLRILIEVSAKEEQAAEAELTAIRDLLVSGGFSAGAAGTRGLGHLTLIDPVVRARRLTRQSIVAALTDEALVSLADAAPSAVPAGTVRIRIPWTPSGPVLSTVAVDGGVADSYPLTEQLPDGVRLVLPGSSVKGVVRSHAERIVRTVTGRETPAAFLDQVGGLAGVSELFGTAGDRSPGSLDPGRRGAITVHDVYSVRAVPAEDWRKVREAAGATPPEPEKPRHSRERGAQDDADLSALGHAVDAFNARHAKDGWWLDVVTRNSIDRWTGGTAEGRLFTAVESHARWRPIVLDVDVARLRRGSGAEPDAALALLLFVLIDAADGQLALGHGTTRGLGAFTVDPEQVIFEAGPGVAVADKDHLAALNGKSLARILADRDLLDGISAAWTRVTASSEKETVHA